MKIDLSQFTGTEGYHKLSLGNMKATDGFACLCEKAKCYWLSDIVSSVQCVQKVIDHSNFIIWRVVKNGSGCIVEAYWDCEENGSYSETKLLYTQKVEYTDFPFDKEDEVFEFYQQGDVVLLKGEH